MNQEHNIDKIIKFEVSSIKIHYKNNNLDALYHPLQNLKETILDTKHMLESEQTKELKEEYNNTLKYLKNNLPKRYYKEIKEFLDFNKQ